MMRAGCTLLLAMLGASCDGLISPGSASGVVTTPTRPTTPDKTDQGPLVKSCTKYGHGLPARMRLLWKSAYLGEVSGVLGPDLAAVASGDGLSPATTKTFAFETAGSLLTDATLESLADSADAAASYALATSASAKSVFGCDALTVTGTAAETCFANFLKTKGAKLLRRPLSDDEVAQEVEFFKSQALLGESDGPKEGFRQGLAALLVHPDFLYLRDAPNGPSSTSLEPHSLAARLSFALVGHGPDDALTAAANDGSLAQHDVLVAQATRLLQSAEGRAQALVFYRNWLGFGSTSYSYSPGFLDGLDVTNVRDDAAAELDQFVTDLTYGGARPGELLTSRATRGLPHSLATIYGAANGATELPENRAGVLTRVGLLASGNDQWHVVSRGLPLLTNFLCRSISPPGFSVADAAKQAEALRVSNIDRIATVTNQAACQGCHSMINPLGGARSDFDAVGRAVTVEKHFAAGAFDYQVPVVATSNLTSVFAPGDSATPVTVNGSVELSRLIAESRDFQGCFAQQYVAHVMGRKDDGDGCLAEDAAAAVAGGGTIADTMRAVVASPEFTLWSE